MLHKIYSTVTIAQLEENKTNLDEGPAVLFLPKELSAHSVEELEYWLNGIMRRVKRRLAEAKSDQNEQFDAPKT